MKIVVFFSYILICTMQYKMTYLAPTKTCCLATSNSN